MCFTIGETDLSEKSPSVAASTGYNSTNIPSTASIVQQRVSSGSPERKEKEEKKKSK